MKISGKLFLAFTIIPFVELYILFQLADLTSPLTTLAIVILTGIIGAYIAKKEGLSIFKETQEKLSTGRLPKDTLIEGLCVLIGGILLLTPGILTDIFGFSLLFPVTRVIYREFIKKHFKTKVNYQMYTNQRKDYKNTDEDEVIDVDYEEIDD